MNKKILVSLSVIAAVAAVVVGGTVAYFSDTEVSTGNTFTAGTLDLLVDSTCHYDGMVCENDAWVEESSGSSAYPELLGQVCSCTWLEKDLDGEVFFSFDDVKPGDWGEDTISLHVVDNDAWVCATLGPLVNRDHGCNEPERKAERDLYGAGNATCDGDPDGELGDNLYFKVWADVCNRPLGSNYPVVIPPAFPGDNVYQEGCDILLTEGPANGDPLNGVTWAIADSNGNVFADGEPVPLEGCETYYLGVGWYVPSEVGNIIQSDSVGGPITFYAEQARHNNTFVCGQ